MKKILGKKFAIIVAIICILLCITVGLVALLGDSKKQGDNSPQTYSVFIKDEYDKPISDIHLKLYYGGGETLTKSPVQTNEKGEAVFEDITEPDCWVEVENAPVEFEINENARYYFDDNNETNIILKDNKDVTELANYEASIGRARYATFTEALDVANQSTRDVTITLGSDISIFELEFKNENSINVTIDGDGHTLTSSGGNHAFKVNQGDCVIEFKNMTVNHGNKGSFIQDYLGNTIKLTDVNLNATGQELTYALINTMGAGFTTNLDFTNVKVKVAVASNPSDKNFGIIRTGNAGWEQFKTVNINLTGCEFDTSASTGRKGIMVFNTTVGEMNITDSKFITKDDYAIKANEQPITIKNSTFSSLSAEYNKTPINQKGYVDSDNEAQANKLDYAAKIGDKEYYTLSNAALAAYTMEDDVVIELVKNTTIGMVEINNAKGNDVTIDGKGYTITSQDDNHAFKVTQSSGVFLLKNATLDHRNYGCALQNNGNSTVAMEDVNILVTKAQESRYAVINLQAAGDNNVLNLTRVNITVEVDTAGKDAYSCIIRTGNGKEEDAKTVMISMKDCNIDASHAVGRTGIMIMDTTTAYVELINTSIQTLNGYPIRANHQTVVLKNSTLKSNEPFYHQQRIEDGTNVIEE